MAGEPLMPIGRFARSCRLSVKALRHYDELGLLEPAFVDPASGYRYYSRVQAREAVMIGMLRSLELPLAAIKRALGAGGDELRALIDEETARLRAELLQKERAVLSLKHLAKGGALMPYEIGLRIDPPRAVAYMERLTSIDALIPDTTELVYALIDDARGSGIPIDDPVLTINDFGDGDERIGLRACVFLPDTRDDASARKLEKAAVGAVAGGPFAHLRHTGPYETLGIAHHALFAWAQEHGHEPLGPIWEFYVNDPSEVAPERLITEVALPLIESAAT